MMYGIFVYLHLSCFGISGQLCHVEPLAQLNPMCFLNRLHYQWIRIFVLLFFAELFSLSFANLSSVSFQASLHKICLHRILFLLTSTLLQTGKHSIYDYFTINTLYCILKEPWKVCNRCFMNICEVTLQIILNTNILSMCTNINIEIYMYLYTYGCVFTKFFCFILVHF